MSLSPSFVYSASVFFSPTLKPAVVEATKSSSPWLAILGWGGGEFQTQRCAYDAMTKLMDADQERGQKMLEIRFYSCINVPYYMYDRYDRYLRYDTWWGR